MTNDSLIEDSYFLHPQVKFKIFDKTFEKSNGVYGLHRSEDPLFQEQAQKNYQAIKENLGVENLLICQHTHEKIVIDADEITDFSKEPQADGIVISKKRVALSIVSADCVPVLLASENGDVIGVAHCGWRDVKVNLLEAVVNKMQEKGAQDISAVIGPAIHQEFYEVGQDFYDEMIASDQDALHFFKPRQAAEKYLFNLPEFVILKLKKLNVVHILNVCEDTFSHPEKYYSYRRDLSLSLKKGSGNTLSTIMILKI